VDLEFRLGERTLRTRVTLTDRSQMRYAMLLGRNTLGERTLRTRVTLTDRSQMRYAMLLGRNTLGGRYVVDVTHTNLLSHCTPEPTEQDTP
jgi:hypothetical protein